MTQINNGAGDGGNEKNTNKITITKISNQNKQKTQGKKEQQTKKKTMAT